MSAMRKYQGEFDDYEFEADELYDDEMACDCCGNKRATDNDGLCNSCRAELNEIYDTLKQYPTFLIEYYKEHFMEDE